MDHIVLLVDDDHNVLNGLARVLRLQPYQLFTATSGEEALHILKTHHVDVIVTDEQMPGMCGGDLRAWVAENCPDVTRIVLTGRPTVDTAIRAINEGAVYQFFTKPCNPARLGIAIRKALEHKALLIENRQLLDASERHVQQIDQCRGDLEIVAALVISEVRQPLQAAADLSQSEAQQYDHSIGLRTATLVDNALRGVAHFERLLGDLLKGAYSELDGNSPADPAATDQEVGGLYGDRSRQSDTVVLTEDHLARPGIA